MARIQPKKIDSTKLLSIIGKKWSISMLHCIAAGHMSFNDLKRNIGNPSAKIMTIRLTELLEAGILDRTIGNDFSDHAIRYSLSKKGAELMDRIRDIESWWK